MPPIQEVAAARISYWQFFRLIFVLFFIYLMGNVFHLWEVYKYNASSEFLPSVALVLILWSIIAVFAAALVWLIFRAFERLCLRMGWEIRIEHLFLYTGVLILFGALSWLGKKLILPNVYMTLQLKLIVFIFWAIISIIPAWLLRNKAKRWVEVIQERITPLVWVFGIGVVLSVPLTAYQTWQEIRTLMTGNTYNINNNQPFITFIFDDVYESTYTKVKPIFYAQGEVACAAITLNYIGKKGRMTRAQILELQNNGWEVVSHTVTHPDLTTLTGPEIEKELKISKNGLMALGFKVANFAYTFNRHNATVRKIARKYYRSARSGKDWKTGFNVNPNILRMYALSSVNFEAPDRLPVLKGYVDYAEENNSWLMITAHNMNPHREAILKSLIDYIQDKGIRIVTINQALDLLGDREESRIAEFLFILNEDSPANILRNVHIISQRLLSLFHDNLLHK